MRVTVEIIIISSIKYSFLKHFFSISALPTVCNISGCDTCFSSDCCSYCQEGYGSSRDDPCTFGMYEH